MKNPLIDALRQAKEPDSQSTFDEVRAANDALQTAAPAVPGVPPEPPEPFDTGDLALESELEPEVIDVPPEPAAGTGAASQPLPETDGRASALTLTYALKNFSGRKASMTPRPPARFEKLASWMPVICLLLGGLAALLTHGWMGVFGTRHALAMTASVPTGPATQASADTSDGVAARFPFESGDTP